MSSQPRNRSRPKPQPPKPQQPQVSSNSISPPPVSTATSEETRGGSMIWRILDVSLLLAAIAFAFWIGGLNTQVAEQKEKLKDIESKATNDFKDLSAKIKSDIKEVETQITNGGILARRYQGDQSDLHRRRQFQFMTPSVDTWASKESFYGATRAQNGGQTIYIEDFRWQQVTEPKIEEFGREIISKGFTKGWRRYPYAGQGRYRDVGWWWVVTVDDSFNIDRFVDYYRQFWGTNEMYVEEFEARSDVMPDGVIPHPVLPKESTNLPGK